MIADRDLHWMDAALAQAAAAGQREEVPVGAVLVRGDRLLARAGNAQRTAADPTAHAEIRVLRLAAARVGNYRLPGSTLYVTLEPCPMCAGAIVWSRIPRLVFGAFDEKAGSCSTLYNIPRDKRLNHVVDIVSGIEGEVAAALLQDFFREKRTLGAES